MLVLQNAITSPTSYVSFLVNVVHLLSLELDVVVTNEHALIKRTVGDFIKEAFKQFVWGINQPAGNRSYQSPFTNVSYYDHTYFNSLFGEFYYPNGTQPEWKAIDTLQRFFMKWFNKLRLTQVLTFPVNQIAA